MILYSNGSSSTYGFDLIKPKDSSQSAESYRLSRTYTAAIEKDLGFDRSINAGEAGSPNSSILRRSIRDLSALLKQYRAQDIFALIAWAPATPTEVYLSKYKRHFNIIFPEAHIAGVRKDKETQKIKYLLDEVKIHHQFLESHVMDFHSCVESFVFSALLLKNFLDQQGIRHRFFHTAPVISCKIHEDGSLQTAERGDLDQNKAQVKQWLENSNLLFKTDSWIHFNTDSLLEHCMIKLKVPLGRTGHILEEGHAAWATYLKEYIKL